MTTKGPVLRSSGGLETQARRAGILYSTLSTNGADWVPQSYVLLLNAGISATRLCAAKRYHRVLYTLAVSYEFQLSYREVYSFNRPAQMYLCNIWWGLPMFEKKKHSRAGTLVHEVCCNLSIDLLALKYQLPSQQSHVLCVT